MGYGTKEFMSKVRTGGFGKMSDWKKRGKTVGWIHLEGFRERKMHNMLVTEIKGKDGEKKLIQKMNVCSGSICPLCALVEWAKDAADRLGEDKDFSVLYRVIKARDKKDQDRTVAYTVAELAGRGDWKRKMAPNHEFLFGWVPRDNRGSENPVEVMQASTALATAIKRVIQSQVEDRGERKGDPMVTPYAMKFTYNKDAIPAQMFNAERVDNDLAPLDEDVKEILAAPMSDYGIDLDKMIQPSSRTEVLSSIEMCWDDDCPVTFAEFEEFYRSLSGEERGDGKTEREKKMGKAQDRRDKMYGKDRENVRDTDREDVDDDGGEKRSRGRDDDDHPPRGRRPSRPQSSDVEADEEKKEEKPSGRRRPVEESAEEEEVSKPSGRRRAEPEEDEQPKRVRKSESKSEEKSDGEKKRLKCPECGEKVFPNKYGRCTECAAEIDIPF